MVGETMSRKDTTLVGKGEQVGSAMLLGGPELVISSKAATTLMTGGLRWYRAGRTKRENQDDGECVEEGEEDKEEEEEEEDKVPRDEDDEKKGNTVEAVEACRSIIGLIFFPAPSGPDASSL